MLNETKTCRQATALQKFSTTVTNTVDNSTKVDAKNLMKKSYEVNRSTRGLSDETSTRNPPGLYINITCSFTLVHHPYF